MHRVEPLSRSDHNRLRFECGEAALDDFLRRHAARQADSGISQTFVLAEDGPASPKEIVGYFTLRPYQLDRSELPSDAQHGYTQTIGAYLLAKFAVARGHQHEGVGTYLLRDVFRRVAGLIDTGGGIGLFVDAKNARLVSFYETHGFIQLAPNSLSLYIPKHNINALLDSLSRET